MISIIFFVFEVDPGMVFSNVGVYMTKSSATNAGDDLYISF